MTDPLPFPLDGGTLILGPSNAGKTRLTAQALELWLADHGPEGVVVFEFGPELRHGGRVLGGRLDRFVTVPDRCWHGVVETHAPRAEGPSTEATVGLARDNARRAADLLTEAPADPEAVFVNDATIPFQHPWGDPTRLTTYCDSARCAVMNAFDSDELGTDDPVSRAEAAVLDTFKSWADRTIELTAP